MMDNCSEVSSAPERFPQAPKNSPHIYGHVHCLKCLTALPDVICLQNCFNLKSTKCSQKNIQ